MHTVADAGPVLVDTVVVGGDRAGPEVRAGADLRVADVRKVWDFRPGADIGVLQLHEGAGLGAVGEAGAGADVRERADLAVVADLGFAGHGVGDHGALAHHDVDEVRVGADDRARRDRRASLEDRARQEAHVGLEHHRRVDVRARRVDHRHAVEHPAPVDAAAQHRLRVGELHPIVHAHCFGGVVRRNRDHLVTRGPEHLDRVGEVVLALRVLRAQPAQRGREQVAAEAVDRRVDLVDLALLDVGVGVLDDATRRGRPCRGSRGRSRWGRPRAP